MNNEKQNDGGPAFPIPEAANPFGEAEPKHSGMSLRDWFAGQATDKEVEAHRGYTATAWGGLMDPQRTIEQARYRFADAMIAAREEVAK